MMKIVNKLINQSTKALPLISPLVLTITKPQREDNKNDMCTCKIMPQEIFLTSDEDELHVVETINQDLIRYEDAAKEMKWRMAMDREIDIIEKVQTWSLVGVKRVDKPKLNENR
uniref:Uncharacterized protein n=1 Tax=Lactuca sativa TaxID=4236 RepID=A0A9R1XC88_LACSA|nr:hypothetical protein LSAT_V11C500291940 [Lactuca sativa]